jgi:hypothetical protein
MSQVRSRAWQGEARPKTPQGHKYNPLDMQGVGKFQIHSSESRYIEGHTPKEADGRRKSLMLPRRWLRLDPIHHGWPCVVKT